MITKFSIKTPDGEILSTSDNKNKLDLNSWEMFISNISPDVKVSIKELIEAGFEIVYKVEN